MAKHPNIRQLLRDRDREYKSLDWRPERTIGLVFVRRRIRQIVSDLVQDVQSLNLSDLPDSGRLRRAQNDIRRAWEELIRNRYYDQATFFVKTGEIFENTRFIFNRLRVLQDQGHFHGENHG